MGMRFSRVSRRTARRSAGVDPQSVAALKKLTRVQLHAIVLEQVSGGALALDDIAQVAKGCTIPPEGKRTPNDVKNFVSKIRRGQLEQLVLRQLANDAVGLDDDGSVVSLIVAPASNAAHVTPVDVVLNAFKAVDPKGKGSVGLDDFLTAMSQPGIMPSGKDPLDEDQLATMFQSFDGKGDGYIQYRAFGACAHPSPHKDKALPWQSKLNGSIHTSSPPEAQTGLAPTCRIVCHASPLR